MSEQPLDFRSAFRAIWRRRMFVFVLVMAGVAGGLAYSFSMATKQVADAVVLLPPSDVTGSTGALSPLTATQIIIATSTPVLDAAGAAASPPLSAAELRGDVDVSALSQDVLQVQVSARTASEAVALANAVATSYVAYVTKSSFTTGPLLGQLQSQSSQLSAEILSFQKRINAVTDRLAAERATSPKGELDASLLASLDSSQQQASFELNNVNSQIVSAEVTDSQAVSATRVLQGAQVRQPSRLLYVLYAVAGGLVGLLAGCLLALLRSRADHRLWLRDSLAVAIGVPVVGSIDSERCKSTREWRRLLVRYQASPVETWAARRALHRLALLEDGNRVVNVLALVGDDAAVAAGVKLAHSAAAAGAEVTLLVGDQPALAGLKAACLALQRQAGYAEGPGLRLGGQAGPVSPGAGSLTVAITCVDKSKPVAPELAGSTLLVVSAGSVDAEPLARAALAASEGHRPIEGILVVNPDPADPTTGALPQLFEARPFSARVSQRGSAAFSHGGQR